METTHTPMLRCDRCGQIIGVYEPVMLLNDAPARQTSLAAEPALRSHPGKRYHQGCYVPDGDGNG